MLSFSHCFSLFSFTVVSEETFAGEMAAFQKDMKKTKLKLKKKTTPQNKNNKPNKNLKAQSGAAMTL